MTYRNHLSPPVFPYAWASAWGEDEYGLWMAMNYQGVQQVFRWVEPGTFMMGSPDSEKGRFFWEDRHEVTLSKGFWIADTTVTQAFWQAIMGENPSKFTEGETDHFPVEQVSWNDVQGFIEKLNHLHPDLRLRLPWEAEWEYACRAGTQTPYHFGEEAALDNINYRGTWDDYETWGEGAKQQTTAVKSYPCNTWGLYDMHGNVWEWCQDSWQEQLGTNAITDPRIEGEAVALRVIRGGSWLYDGRNVRSAYRSRDTHEYRFDHLGFRLLLGL